MVNACNTPPVSLVPPAMMHLPSIMASLVTRWRSANRVVSLYSTVVFVELPSGPRVVNRIVVSLTESTVPRKPPNAVAGSPALSLPPVFLHSPPLDAPTTTAFAVTVPPSAPLAGRMVTHSPGVMSAGLRSEERRVGKECRL